MFAELSPEAKQVLEQFAPEEARLLGTNFIATEQILLGILGLEKGLAVKALEAVDVNLPKAREAVQQMAGRGTGSTAATIPLTPRAQRIVEMAAKDASAMGHEKVTPEHLLLALLKEGDGLAVRVLQHMGVNLNELMQKILPLMQLGSPE